MKIFFYKSLVVVFLFLVSFHLTFSFLFKKIKTEIANNFSKDKIEIIKEQIRSELQNAIQKEDYIKPSDAKLINQFLIKIKSDLDKNN